MSKFANDSAFEDKLREHMDAQASQEGCSVEQVKNEIAYERFLARMDPARMTLKGGYAVKSQVPASPYTKDIDMVLIGEQLPSDKAMLLRALKNVIANQLDQQKLDDHFQFDIGEPMGFSDLEPNDAAARISVRAYIGASDERFATFPLDIALADRHILPPLMLPAPNHLSWAEIETAQVSVVPPEYLFADKLLIYVAARNVNRVNDVVHMALLTEQGLSLDKVGRALKQLADQRGLQTKIAQPLSEPPEGWGEPFERSMHEAKSNLTIDQALESIRNIHQQLLDRGLLR